jgi:hypothetical protein
MEENPTIWMVSCQYDYDYNVYLTKTEEEACIMACNIIVKELEYNGWLG